MAGFSGLNKELFLRCVNATESDYGNALAHTMRELLLDMSRNQQIGVSMSCSAFLDVVGALWGNFVLNAQADAEEFLIFLLSYLHEDLKTINQVKAVVQTLQLEKSKVILSALSGIIVNTGEISVKVQLENVVHNLTLITCNHTNEFKPLLGRDWLDVLWPHWRNTFLNPSINNLLSVQAPTFEQLATLFPRPFAQNADTAIEGFTAKLLLKDNAQPIFAKAYPLPLGMEQPVNEVLDKLVNNRKALRVRASEWASPGFAVPKKDGKVRYVVDFKRTLNPQLRVDFYPLPTPDHVFLIWLEGNFSPPWI
ncbi:hypothetical protein KUF71_004860 [Frankliniella fusca]|uniref:Peptidase C19 ubiquitin carboxyl-terminal hydrolase domain-containing protein n=1 Tax=Frankliniella fusca TaxID=407009 RepID=A0AAE1LDA0_9NEOP|nr:hypothetical protein KUF71_004860 [Frankliniella fusca]